MALANYTDLKTSIALWLPRADLTSLIPDFVLMAEAIFNRELRTLQQETQATFSITGEFVAVPSDFLAVRSLRMDTNIKRAMEYLAPDTGVNAYATTGTPHFFSISGNNIRFAPAPDTTYSATLIYYAKIPPMASNATNWLLTSNPDLYLHMSLFCASVHINDANTASLRKQLADSIMADLNKQSAGNRWGGNSMAMRAA